jgi:creatinine amidohydrolase
MIKPWAECSSAHIKRNVKKTDIAALVVGSCEQHARHLPLGTDTIIGEYILAESAKKAAAAVYMLPSLAYGFSHHHLNFAGSVSMEQETLAALVRNIMLHARSAGFTRFLIMNAHGGNMPALHFAVNELGSKHGLKAILIKYWDFFAGYIKEWRDTPLGGIGHAGEMETSCMLRIRPDLVDMSLLSGYECAKGNEWFNPDMFAPNRITMFNMFEVFSPYGNVGKPDSATAEKGGKLLEYATEKIAAFLDGFWEENPFV